MRLIDLSQLLENNSPGAPFYPKPRIKLPKKSSAREWSAEMLTLPSHCGTHIDMPNHKLAQWKSSSDYGLESFVGPAYIVDFRDLRPGAGITADMLKSRLPGPCKGMIVLIATGWAQKRAHTDEWYRDIPYLMPEAAGYLAENWVMGVGIDHWSIGGSVDPVMTLTHTILMAGNCWIVENLEFPPETFGLSQPVEFWSLPIKLSNLVSGFFCRAVLRLP